MDILFVDFPSFLSVSNWHLGPRSMISALRKNGFKSGIYYPPQFTLRAGLNYKKIQWVIENLKQGLEIGDRGCQPALLDNPLFAPLIKKMVLDIKRLKPILLGFSPCDGSLLMLIDFVRQLRKARVRSRIVLGGHYSALVHDQILKHHPEIDFIVRGEGEETICELIESFKTKRPLGQVLGLSFREKNRVKINAARPLIKDLDSLPFPATDHYRQLTRVEAGTFLELTAGPARQKSSKDICHEYVPFSSSRGCYGACSYCSIQSFYRASPHDKLWRAQSPTRTVAQMALLNKRFGIFRFNFVDDAFLAGRVGRERALAIAQKIEQQKLKVEFAITTRANDLDKDTLKVLQKAGLVYVFLGIDSAFQRGLDTFNKHIKEETNYRALKLLNEMGLKANINIIPFEPYLKPEEITASLKFTRYLIGMENVALLQPFIDLSVYQGISLVPKLRKEGLLTGNYIKHGYKFADRRSARIYSLFSKIPGALSGLLRDLVLGAKFNLIKEAENFRRDRLPLIINQIKYISRYTDWLGKTFKFQLLEDAAELYKESSPPPTVHGLLLERVENERARNHNLYHSMAASFLGKVQLKQLKQFTVKGLNFVFCGTNLLLWGPGPDNAKYLERLNDSGQLSSAGEELVEHRALSEQPTAVMLEMLAREVNLPLFGQTLEFFGNVSEVNLLFSDRNEPEKLAELIGQIRNICRRKNISVDTSILSEKCEIPLARSLTTIRPVRPQGKHPAGEKALYFCTAGITSFFIDGSGDIYPCQKFKKSNALLLGNAFTGKWRLGMRRLFIDAMVDKKQPCFNCWAKFVCGGGCLYEAYQKNSSIYKPDQSRCPSLRRTILDKLKEAALRSLAGKHAIPVKS